MQLIKMTQLVLENSEMREKKHRENPYQSVTEYLFDTMPVFQYAKFISLPVNKETCLYFENVYYLDFKHKAVKGITLEPIAVHEGMTIEDLINYDKYSKVILNEKGIEKLGFQW